MPDGYDVIIIGGGSAALAAAMTCQARGKRTAVVANGAETTNLYKAERIANYPGAENITGRELAELFRRQLDSCGADIITGRALSVMPLGESFGVAVEITLRAPRSSLQSASRGKTSTPAKPSSLGAA